MNNVIVSRSKARERLGERHPVRALVLLLVVVTAGGCAVMEEEPMTASDPTAWQEVRSWPFDDNVRDVALANDGSFVVIAANTQWEPRGIVVLDAATGAVRQIDPDGEPPMSVAVSPDSSTIVGSWPGRVGVYTAEGTKQRDIPYQRGNQLRAFNDIAFTPDGETLVGVAEDIAWVSVSTGEFTQERPVPAGRSMSVAVDDAGTVVAEQNVEIGLVNADEEAPRCLVPLEEPGDVAISPDGSRFAAARFRAGFSVWNSSDCSLVSSWSNEAYSSSIAWLPDNRHLAASSNTGIISFWDTETGELVHTLQAYDDGNILMAMTPDARTMVTIRQSKAGPITLWRSGGK